MARLLLAFRRTTSTTSSLASAIRSHSAADTARVKRPDYFFFDFFLSGACDNAEPAAALEFFPVLPSLNTFEADLAAFFPVCSFLAIAGLPVAGTSGKTKVDPGRIQCNRLF